MRGLTLLLLLCLLGCDDPDRPVAFPSPADAAPPDGARSPGATTDPRGSDAGRPDRCSDADDDCDGWDDDCDGAADEAADIYTDPRNCGACGVRCELAGATARCAGGICELARCLPDRADCNGDPEDGCETTGGCPADSSCDGVDDDGDGAADEGYVPVAACGVGICRDRARASRCVSGAVEPCRPGAPQGVRDATCDGVDDDCDGRADEDFVPDASCGVGACPALPSRCEAGEVVACEPAAPAVDRDGCGGVDEDCDGRVDEDVAEDDRTCDRFDDDCDGGLDEDCPEPPALPRLFDLDLVPEGWRRREDGRLVVDRALGVVVGDVLVSAEGDGLLLGAVAVADGGGGEVVVDVRSVALEEVVGVAELAAHLDFSWALLRGGGGMKHGPIWGELAELGEFELARGVRLRGAAVAFDTEVDVEATFCGPLCLSRFAVVGERILRVRAGVEVDLPEAARFAATLMLDEVPPFRRFAARAGRAPLVLRGDLAVELTVDVDVEGATAFSAAWEASHESLYGFVWTPRDGWVGYNEWGRRTGAWGGAAYTEAAGGRLSLEVSTALHLSASGSPGPSATSSVTSRLRSEPAVEGDGFPWEAELCGRVSAAGSPAFARLASPAVVLTLGEFCGVVERGVAP